MNKLPGGELAHRPLFFFWILDCSGSMAGEKIEKLNFAIKAAGEKMKDTAESNPNAQLLIRILKFSSGAQWMTASPVEITQFQWGDKQLEASGLTDMGKAFELLADQLKIPPMPERALPPVLALISDGQPTDDYKKGLNKLLSLPWGKKAVRVAISVEDDSNLDMLAEFTGNKELVLLARNSTDLVNMIKWASTIPGIVSSPDGSLTIRPPQFNDRNNDIVNTLDDGDVW